jgi:MoaA/NifB/PqqE/SkfB family radical SAM enzyme
MNALAILYRGPLDACNYACGYCPFAKRAATRAMLDADRAALTRFLAWAEGRPDPFSVLFTPWGEGLVHAWYREALVRLSHHPQVVQAAIQTNGSASFAWTAAADRRRLALWITWHPGEVDRERFRASLEPLRENRIRFSVGAVGVPAHLDQLEALRAELPADIPLWINAQKPAPAGGYDARQLQRFTGLDPRFALTLSPQRSRGRACRTGDQAIAVDGEGTIRRCHFVAEPLGNLYRDDLAAILRPRPCPRARCDCFIGFAHLAHLGLDAEFGDGLLARIPLAATAL